MALLLPAVQAAREAARRMSCSNNLKQLGIALHNYHDTYKRFPFNGAQWGRPVSDHRGSYFVKLLPFIEQAPLYDQIDYNNNTHVHDQVVSGGLPLRSVTIPGLRCPSDPHEPMINGDTSTANYAMSMGAQRMESDGGTNCKMSQVINVSVQPWSTPDPNWPGENWFGSGNRWRGDQGTRGQDISGIITRAGNYEATGGPSSYDAPWAARLSDITDGTANVIAFGEVIPWCGDHSRNGWASPNGVWFATTAPINWNTCPGEGGLDRNEGSNPPCNRTNAWNASLGFKSVHAGGAQFTMCDGSVHFLAETIDYDLYQRLGDRRDGNPVSIP